MRLVPQHCLTGLAEALNLIGQIEFYYSEFPKTMSSIGVSLLALGLGFGAMLGSAIIAIIGATTRRDGHDLGVATSASQSPAAAVPGVATHRADGFGWRGIHVHMGKIRGAVPYGWASGGKGGILMVYLQLIQNFNIPTSSS